MATDVLHNQAGLREPDLADLVDSAPHRRLEDEAAEGARTAVVRWRRGFAMAPHALVDAACAGQVSPMDLLAYLVLQRWERAFPSSAHLGELMRVDARTVRTRLRALQEAGWVSRTMDSAGRRIIHVHDRHGVRPPDAGHPPPPDARHPPPPDAGHPRMEEGSKQEQAEQEPPPTPANGGGVLLGKLPPRRIKTPNPEWAAAKKVDPGDLVVFSATRGAVKGVPKWLEVDNPAWLAAVRAPIPAQQATPGALPKWASDLARQLGEVYPHAITETGRVRRPGPTQVARRLVLAFSGTPPNERQALVDQLLMAAQAEARARPLGSHDRRFSKSLDVWINQRCWEAPAEVVAGGGEVSPCEASWRHSTAKAERERQARNAADPTRTPPEAVPPEVLARLEAERAAARARLEASRQEALARARLIADQPGPAGDAARHLLASAGEAPAGPVAASGTPAAGQDQRPAPPSDPGGPRGPRGRRPARPRAEILAELEEHRRKTKPDGEGVSRVG